MMSTFIMLTKLAPDALEKPDAPQTLAQAVTARVEKVCPSVEWKSSYVTLGPYDYLDIFEAPDIETAMQVGTIVLSVGHARTEIWAATDWRSFKALAQGTA